MNGSNRGFTLIELLVAITIMAIVAVLGWRGLDSIIRTRVALTEELASTRGLQLAFAQMQSDCDKIAKADQLGGLDPLDVRPGRLTLVRTVFIENQPSRAQVIAYRVMNGELTRRESVATRDLAELNAAWTAALGDAGVLPAVVLHSDVNGMDIRVWDDGRGWRNAGAGAAPQQSGVVMGSRPPTGLEVSLYLRGREGSLAKIFLLGAV
jgi:general secretion pathway protein J